MAGASRGDAATSLELRLTTDRAVDVLGEAIVLVLSVSNRTAQDVEVRFASAQRFDFVIRDASATEVWRWSADQMFASVLGTEVIAPRSALVYREVFSGTLPAGSYSVEGVLVAEQRLSASVNIHAP